MWYQVSEHHAREKIGQCFRDRLHAEYRSSSKAKIARRKMAEGRRLGELEKATTSHRLQELKAKPLLEQLAPPPPPPLLAASSSAFGLAIERAAAAAASSSNPAVVEGEGAAFDAFERYLRRRSSGASSARMLAALNDPAMLALRRRSSSFLFADKAAGGPLLSERDLDSIPIPSDSESDDSGLVDPDDFFLGVNV